MQKRAVITYVNDRRGLVVATTDDGEKVKFSRIPYRRGERVLVEDVDGYVEVERFDSELEKRS